jgi:ABC-type Fe3+-siderophore transport system permease subunit
MKRIIPAIIVIPLVTMAALGLNLGPAGGILFVALAMGHICRTLFED